MRHLPLLQQSCCCRNLCNTGLVAENFCNKGLIVENFCNKGFAAEKLCNSGNVAELLFLLRLRMMIWKKVLQHDLCYRKIILATEMKLQKKHYCRSSITLSDGGEWGSASPVPAFAQSSMTTEPPTRSPCLPARHPRRI